MKHPYHLVDISPWPLAAGFATFITLSGLVTYMHQLTGAGLLLVGLACLLYTMVYWWRDVVREGTYEGAHTLAVQQGLRYGMILFILSEVLFFAAFFWAFFHHSITPDVAVGNVWPPVGIQAFNPWSLPFINTIILLSSGVTVTWSHHSLQKDNRQAAIIGLILTIALGLSFTACQAHEYHEATFALSSGIYGSTFYMATGFHGLHVIIGSIFLAVCLYRMFLGHFTMDHHVGYEAAIWYWHFVDVVWLFLFSGIYWWGS